MTLVVYYAIGGVASYLLGAVPFGLLVARAKGIDIRSVGSKNIGATNVFRSVSKPLGILTFVLDALKGLTPSLVFPMIIRHLAHQVPSANLGLCFGVLAIAGHNWPVYLGFRGGKGVATSAGALLGVTPLAILAGLVGWIGALVLTRYVSVASMFAAFVAVIAGWILYLHISWVIPTVLTLLGAAIVVRHRANIQRLMNGQEPKIGNRSKV